MKKALITGVTGQDGSYLSELLLSKGYEVHGIKRRSSSFNTQRLEHLYQDPHLDHRNFILHYGDLTDATNIIRIIQEVQPDEIYNLGAQSHVGVSFDTPEYTANVDALGTMRILEAVRILGLKNIRIYQASTSELYGKVQEIPQSETTPFYPRSPYGVAKLYGYWIGVNYREAYGMYVCNGVLFNHETIAGFMPMIYKIGINGDIDIKPISEIVKNHTNVDRVSIDENLNQYQETEVTNDLYVWDSNGWTKVLYASAYPHDVEKSPKSPRYIVAKNAAFLATGNHVCIMDGNDEKKLEDIIIGDNINLIEFPTLNSSVDIITPDEAKLLGFIVGDGYSDNKTLQITSKNKEYLKPFEVIWLSLNEKNTVYYYCGKSGFNEKVDIWQLHLNNPANWISKFEIYDEYRKKRIPSIILNASIDIKMAFLQGYQMADGLKSKHHKYEFSNFKTNSATLASGLIYLLNSVTKQEYNINIEYVYKFDKFRLYYSINILSNSILGQNHKNTEQSYNKVIELIDKNISQREISRILGVSRDLIRKIQRGYIPNGKHHLIVPKNKVKKIIDLPNYEGWFYDLTTESGTFHCGVGQGHVHNSPRRGETFVTRKITMGIAAIVNKKQDKLYLGNLDAQRDWGHARDYVRAMWLMLQQEKPEDFVIATGVTTSVREFVTMAFAEVGITVAFEGQGEAEKAIVVDSKKYPIPLGTVVVEVDKRHYRPTEVDILLGDPTKANTQLQWYPEVDLKELVREMVRSDMDRYL